MASKLTAYFDESYNQINSKRPNEPLVYTVSCWLSTTEKWRKFGKRWKRILKDVSLDYFHMSEYESRVGPYSDWSDSKRVRVLQELHRAIRDYALYGCATIVNCIEFDEAIELEGHPLKAWPGRSYYAFDVQTCMMLLGEWYDKTPEYDGPIQYLFAHLAKQGNVLDPMFEAMLSSSTTRQRYRLTGTWSKGLMKYVPQLQAADIVAYEINKRAANQAGEDSNYVRKSLENLRLSEKFTPIYYGADELARWSDLSRQEILEARF